MHIFNINDVSEKHLKGRILRNAVGKDDAFSISDKMTVTYAKYSKESGPMLPHKHAEETVYILDAIQGFFSYGKNEETLDNRIDLRPGMILHVQENEWHVFQYIDDGYIEALCIYGQTENLR